MRHHDDKAQGEELVEVVAERSQAEKVPIEAQREDLPGHEDIGGEGAPDGRIQSVGYHTVLGDRP
jgi:hypothetical protein